MIEQTRFSRHYLLLCSLLIFTVCFIPRVILAWMAVTVRTPGDEFATIFFSGFLAGKNWQGLMAHARYYGFGMNLFTWWIFKLPVTPIIQYRMLLSFCGVLQSLTGVVCFHILKECNLNLSMKFKMAISVLCSFMVVTRNTVYYNENALILITWLCVWMIFKLLMYENYPAQKKKYTLGISMLLSFSLVFHERSLTYILAFFVLLILYFIFYKKILVNIKIFLPVCFIGVAIARVCVSVYQSTFWSGAESIKNASIPSVSSYQFTLQQITTSIGIFFGQLGTASIISGGIFFFGSGIIFIIAIKHLSKSFRLQDEQKALFMMGFFALTCTIATVFYQSLSWGRGANNAIYYDGNVYSLKAFTYVRYFGPYIGVVFLIGLLFFLKYFNATMTKVFLAIYIVALLLWVEYLIPIIARSHACSEAFICFIQAQAKATGTAQYYAGVIFAVNVLLLITILIRYVKNRASILIILGIFLVYQYVYNAYFYDITQEKNNIASVDASYQLIKELEASGIDLGPKLYVEDERETNHPIYFIFQLYLPDYVICPDYPEVSDENIFMITNNLTKTTSNMDIEGLAEFYLDNKEILLTNNAEVISYMNER